MSPLWQERLPLLPPTPDCLLPAATRARNKRNTDRSRSATELHSSRVARRGEAALPDEELMYFASDNTAGVAPEIMDALARANTGYALGYGNDEWTKRVEARFAEIFEKEVAVF